jgi:phosphatidylinositol 4-kinase
MLKIEEMDDSLESEEEFKKIDDYVKKKVREDNICKTPEKGSRNNSKEIPGLNLSNLSPDVTVSDRKDLIKNNKSSDYELQNHLENENKVTSNNNNRILSMLNQNKEKIEPDSKSDGTPTTNNSILEEHNNSNIVTNNNEHSPIRQKQLDKKKKVKIVESHTRENSNVLMEDSVIEKKTPHRKKSPRKTQKRSKSKKMYEAIEHHSIMESLPSQNELNLSLKDEIFGEKIDSQHERLKKVSPFGNFNTFKLFKVIIKNGEDLRQEQFATQLINEFYQIFQLEDVDIWLKPYEILSTGNNVGLIECVPNSVSLDYLKRKWKNINSLSQFYETYFGPVNSESNLLA